MVCLDTLKSLSDDGRDVLEEIIPDTEQYYTEKRAAILNEYKHRGIGSCDVDYWVNCMTTRYFTIAAKYDIAFERWNAYKASTKDFADGSSEYTMRTEHEDNPDNPQGSTVYLSDRTTQTYSGKTFGGLGSTTAAEYIADIPNTPQDFAREFRELFYWGL